MSKKMQKALLAFINEDVDQAKKLLRQVFIESAQKVNKELEESFDSEEEELSEDVDQDPEADLEGEVEYKLDEGWGDEGFGQEQPMEEAEESPVPEQEPAFGDEEEPADDFPMGDESADAEAAGQVEGDEFQQIKVLVDELSEIFDSLQSGGEPEVDMGEPEEGGFGEEEPEADGEFDDVPMGDSKFGESYKMKPVAAPEKSEKAGGNKKSPVAQVAKSPVDGVKPVQIKNGTVVTSDKEFKNSDTESVKVEDNNNVMDSAKGMMKDVKVPKHTAEKSRSPLPKK